VVKVVRIAVLPGSIGAVFDDPVSSSGGGGSRHSSAEERRTGHTDLTSKSIMVEHAMIGGYA